MAETEMLLTMRPKDAIVKMLNDENGTTFPHNTFDISPPVSLGGRVTQVHMKVRRSVADDDDVPYSGELDFTYRRLDVNQHMSDVLSGFRPPLPTSTQVLLDEITRRTGQEFFIEDFVLEDIFRSNAAPYVLKAKQESWRWVGQTEIMLVDLIDLNTYLADATPSPGLIGTLPSTAELASYNLAVPYLNGTPMSTLMPLIGESGTLVQGNNGPYQFVYRTLVRAGQFLTSSSGKWGYSSANPTAPSSYDLYGATWSVKDAGISTLRYPVINPNLNRVMEITIRTDGFYNAVLPDRLTDTRIQIPYRAFYDFEDSEFRDDNRLIQSGVVSMSDGSAYAKWLNTLQPGQVLTSSSPHVEMYLSGPFPWFVNPSHVSNYNLYGSVVQYNGQLRPIDIKPATPGLNRVLVLTMGEASKHYRGNISFFYKSVITINEEMPDVQLGIPYNFALQPQGGVGTYSATLRSSTLAPGLSLNAVTQTISGTVTDAAQVGQKTVTVRVSDTDNNYIDHTFTYRVVIAPLSLQGDAPNGTVGQALNYTYNAVGGVAPYTLLLDNGQLPPGISIQAGTTRLVGNFTAAGTYTFTLRLLDSRGVSTPLGDSIRVT